MAGEIRSIAGKVSDVRLGSDYTYVPNYHNDPAALKNQLVSMRIDNRPVLFRTRTLPSISNGDHAVAAGPDNNGTLEALAMKNVSTGATYCDLPWWAVPVGWFAVVMGILFAPILIGLFFLYIGVKALRQAGRVKKALALLHSNGA